jgi:hypothetical protein
MANNKTKGRVEENIGKVEVNCRQRRRGSSITDGLLRKRTEKKE